MQELKREAGLQPGIRFSRSLVCENGNPHKLLAVRQRNDGTVSSDPRATGALSRMFPAGAARSERLRSPVQNRRASRDHLLAERFCICVCESDARRLYWSAVRWSALRRSALRTSSASICRTRSRVPTGLTSSESGWSVLRRPPVQYSSEGGKAVSSAVAGA